MKVTEIYMKPAKPWIAKEVLSKNSYCGVLITVTVYTTTYNEEDNMVVAFVLVISRCCGRIRQKQLKEGFVMA